MIRFLSTKGSFSNMCFIYELLNFNFIFKLINNFKFKLCKTRKSPLLLSLMKMEQNKINYKLKDTFVNIQFHHTYLVTNNPKFADVKGDYCIMWLQKQQLLWNFLSLKWNPTERCQVPESIKSRVVNLAEEKC